MSPQDVLKLCDDMEAGMRVDQGFAWTYRTAQHLQQVRLMMGVLRLQIIDIASLNQTVSTLTAKLAATEDELKKEKAKKK